MVRSSTRHVESRNDELSKRLTGLALLVLGGSILIGCTSTRTSPDAGPVDSARPADHPPDQFGPDESDPNELAESHTVAMGFPLPEGFAITGRTMASVVAFGSPNIPQTLAYVRARIDSPGTVSVDDTVFNEVKMSAGRAPLAPHTNISVAKHGTVTKIQIWTQPVAVETSAAPVSSATSEP